MFLITVQNNICNNQADIICQVIINNVHTRLYYFTLQNITINKDIHPKDQDQFRTKV